MSQSSSYLDGLNTPITFGEEAKKVLKKEKVTQVKASGIDGFHINMVVDASGSMQPHTEATIKALNGYIAEQQKTTEKMSFSLSFFEEATIEQVIKNQPIKEVKQVTTDDYVIGGSTNLCDAVGNAFECVSELLTGDPAKDPAIIIVIMTDGAENRSKKYNKADIKDLCEKAQKVGWKIVFMGAGIDSWASAQTYGISKGNDVSYSADCQEAAFRGISNQTRQYVERSSKLVQEGRSFGFGAAAIATKAAEHSQTTGFTQQP